MLKDAKDRKGKPMASKLRKNRHKEISKIVGTNVNRIRLMSGISQEALGEKLGLTFQQVQKYERGVNRISAPVLVELAAIFSVEITEFFAGCSPSKNLKAVKSSPFPNINPRTVRLAERLTALRPGKAREGLFQLIDALTSD